MTGSSSASSTDRAAGLIWRVFVWSVGLAATSVSYLALFVFQTVNADLACETVPEEIRREFRDVKFENSLLNLGGRCTWYLSDGSAMVTREPGWWLTAVMAVGLLVLVGFSVMIVRQRGHQGWLYALVTFVAPPLGMALAVTARDRLSEDVPAPRAAL